VGAGPFPTEVAGDEGDALVSRGHEWGTNTGRRRRTGWFDAVMVRHAVRLNSLDELAITKLDVLDTFEKLKVCVAYETGGKRYEQLPWHQSVLYDAVPVYEELPGWRCDTTGVHHEDDLPGPARKYLDFLAEQSGVPISYVGVGPERAQVVALNVR
jgi:adenylosuccinate synthase